jgi:uncharacterized protein YjbI with pentapeptide repeats
MVDHPPQPADDDNAKAQERRRLIRRLAVAGPFVLGLLVVLLLACVLWIPKWLYPTLTDNDLKDVKTTQNELDAAKIQELKGARLKLQNDARTTLLQGLGALLLLTGAGIGAYVTLRQVRVSQDGLHATREQMQHTLETTRQQLNLTEQSQVTDRYTRAVEQLGHEKAPVRLGALYSLEHLAQDNPEYRQTVVDVFCAYLRMPYTPPVQTDPDAEQVEETALSANGRDRPPHAALGHDPAREEFQVRQTAQRLLANHLRCPPKTSGQEAQLLPPSPEQAFWPGISLDLTGATLVDFNFEQVSVIRVRFVGATYQGAASFGGATFQGAASFGEVTFQGASFDNATFQGNASFDNTTFQGNASFDKTTFQGVASFGQVTFQSGVGFDGATFQGFAWFGYATFQNLTRFDKATFQGFVKFNKATFQGAARFHEVTFQSGVIFDGATFQGNAWFNGATFQGNAWFVEVTFQGGVGFDGATYQGFIRFGGAHALHFDDPNVYRMWPDGWAVLPDPTDPSRGTLVGAEDAKGSGPGSPLTDTASGSS